MTIARDLWRERNRKRGLQSRHAIESLKKKESDEKTPARGQDPAASDEYPDRSGRKSGDESKRIYR